MQKGDRQLVKVYVRTQAPCQPCVAVKRWLDRAGVEYETLAAEDHKGYLEGLGYRSAPVVEYEGGHFHGFIPAKLEALR
jgi:glutaredoxin